ncbi:MAG: prephenate dehydrogenase/arogenate dehydrogenase family protein [Zhaonellaceae bacterium]|nr:prephenate dehydrogenase [Clostridia bacterium]
MIKQISIIGLGLIGGSIGLAVKKNNPQIKVIGIDVKTDNLNLAIKRNAIDQGTTDLKTGVIESDIVFLATPINTMYEIAKLISPFLKKQAIVTDVGSCKVEVTNNLEKILPTTCNFVGGHPMAGSEQAGMAHADPYLFQNAVYVLTPTEKTNPKAVKDLSDLLKSIGANVIEMVPSRHDLIVAAVSHLPHLLAVNLVNSVGEYAEKDDLTLMLAAGGFRDTTRIAMGNEDIWSDIFISNVGMILQVLQTFNINLAKLESFISQKNDYEIKKIISKARRTRQEIPLKPKGLLPKLYELTLKVPDEPGIIAKIAKILSDEQINIIDIEILRVREGEEGAIRIGLKEEDDFDAAFKLLEKNNFEVKRR